MLDNHYGTVCVEGRRYGYGMISNVKSVSVNGAEGVETEEVIRALIHELQNHLHSATMEAELAELGVAERVDPVKLLRILDSFKNALLSLRECIFPSQDLTREDPMSILNSVLADLDNDNKDQQRKFSLGLIANGPMPMVELNKEYARYALGRILAHCRRRLKNGGDLQVATGSKNMDGNLFAKIAITLVGSSPDDGANDGRDYGMRNNSCVDLEMALATEMLKRYGGRLLVDRDAEKHGRVTIMLKAAC